MAKRLKPYTAGVLILDILASIFTGFVWTFTVIPTREYCYRQK